MVCVLHLLKEVTAREDVEVLGVSDDMYKAKSPPSTLINAVQLSTDQKPHDEVTQIHKSRLFLTTFPFMN